MKHTMTRREFAGRVAAGLSTLHPVPARRPRARSVILLWMDGGPSHLDTFDPKPLAPAEIRGEMGAIPTGIPGVRVSELLPRLARWIRRMTLIRTVSHTAYSHERACCAMMTGRSSGAVEGLASIGSIAARCLGASGATPAYAVLPGTEAAQGYCQAGGLHPASLPVPVSAGRVAGSEWSSAAELYGRHPFGLRCLAARRLVETGSRFVLVSFGGWDTHGDHSRAFRERLLPPLDLAMSALLADLRHSGLLSETLVVWTGEFGRSPRINALGGRDHWPAAFSAIFAGAGVPEGQVIGETDAYGAEPRVRVVGPEDVAGAILRKLGLSPRLWGLGESDIPEL